jgi:hypothetical protein
MFPQTTSDPLFIPLGGEDPIGMESFHGLPELVGVVGDYAIDSNLEEVLKHILSASHQPSFYIRGLLQSFLREQALVVSASLFTGIPKRGEAEPVRYQEWIRPWFIDLLVGDKR